MMPPWLITLSWVSIGASIATAVAIGADVLAHPQRMGIMNAVWPVSGLYLPVAGWWIYAAIGRPKASESGAPAALRPLWKSIFLSATHCASGCVIGDVIGAPIVLVVGWRLFGERLFADYVVELALAYAFGIAFQYLPIRKMPGISRREAVLDAVKADTLSLVAFEVGMFGWMAIANFLLFATKSPDASSPVFWLMMQVGMILGLLTTYPANWLLVKWGVKGGM